jgi:hypothetical protein
MEHGNKGGNEEHGHKNEDKAKQIEEKELTVSNDASDIALGDSYLLWYGDMCYPCSRPRRPVGL